MLVYKSLILPIFDYAAIIYHNLNQADAVTLQRLENAACHAILKTDHFAHISDMHEELNITTLYQRHFQHICNATHKLLHGLGPAECIELLRYVHEIHNISTRHAEGMLLHIPPTRMKCCERDFTIMSPKVWNQVPVEIRQIVSHEEFKKQIKLVKFA